MASSTSQLEQRVAALEAEVTNLKSQLDAMRTAQPWWEQIAGTFQRDAIYEEAMRLGRQYRRSDAHPHDVDRARVGARRIRAGACTRLHPVAAGAGRQRAAGCGGVTERTTETMQPIVDTAPIAFQYCTDGLTTYESLNYHTGLHLVAHGK